MGTCLLHNLGGRVNGTAFRKTTPLCLKSIHGTLSCATTISADDEPIQKVRSPACILWSVYRPFYQLRQLGTTSVDLVASLDLLAEMEAHPMLELSLKKMGFNRYNVE
ncbi:MAG: hypothetical protein NT023_04845 [Armatimonadetes bacterium]|nr:hypothetical protein [Armatimonadota bacterium]